MKNEKKGKRIIIEWKPDKTSRIPLYTQIADYFGERIRSGAWTNGQILPSQRQLAQDFGVNRSTIVEAMSVLYSLGLLQTDYRGGTRVSVDAWNVMAASDIPDWRSLIDSGHFRSNQEIVQLINRCEFDSSFLRLGTGEMSGEILPTEQIQKALLAMSRQKLYIQYSNPLGSPELRGLLCEKLRESGIDAAPENVLIVSGALQGLQLIASGICRQDMILYTDSPSYISTINVFQSAGARIRELPMDREGILPWMVREEQNSIFYVIPNFQNPTGLVMSDERRGDLITYSKNHRVPIIEDDVFHDLWLDQPPGRPLKSLDRQGNVIYVGSMSKCMSPGLRIGWVVGPEAVVQRLSDVKMQMDYGASTLSQQLAANLFGSGLYEKTMVDIRRKLRYFRDVFFRYLDEYFRDLAEWNIPAGGFMVWVRLKGKVSSRQVFRKALKEGLLITPGIMFGTKYDNYLRLSYGYLSEEELKRGLMRLSEIVRAL